VSYHRDCRLQNCVLITVGSTGRVRDGMDTSYGMTPAMRLTSIAMPGRQVRARRSLAWSIGTHALDVCAGNARRILGHDLGNPSHLSKVHINPRKNRRPVSVLHKVVFCVKLSLSQSLISACWSAWSHNLSSLDVCHIKGVCLSAGIGSSGTFLVKLLIRNACNGR
jgi:hypothetical protein